MSRYATDWECWAILPEVQITPSQTTGIDINDGDLKWVAKQFDLVLHGN
jgi:hypothetical protein